MNKGIYRIAAGVGAVVILVSSCTVQASMVTTNGTPAAVATDSIVNWPAAPAVTSETAVLMDAVRAAKSAHEESSGNISKQKSRK